ncbi:putative virion structural protein [Salmonella phage vB_SalM_SA002]|nr:putative virion structural protein [Salmonella phage vB_SalM_SA002]
MLLGSGLEAIAFQRTRPVFTLLTAEVQSLMDKMVSNNETKLTDALLKESKIPTILSAASGFDNITMVADQYAPINAYTNIITISKMHVFHDKWRRQFTTNADAYALYRQTNNVLTGQIDLETGRVSGDFSKIPLTIGLGNQFLNPKYGFTAAEVAAILLHELGHDFTYCYTLHYTCTTNMVLALAAKAIVAESDNRQKHAIMTDLQNTLGIRIDNMDELTRYDKYEDYYITMLGSYRKKTYDALGSPSYNTNMSEQMADMFAARHGGGAAIVTGLNRMNKLFTPPTWYRAIERAQGILAFVMLSPITVPLFLVGVFVNDFVSGTYDLDKDRFIRIRNEAIASLKDQSLSSDEKKTIMSEIDTINEIIKSTDNDWSFAGKVAMLVRSSQRTQSRQKNLLQDLEALTNNPLYVAAAKYSV